MNKDLVEAADLDRAKRFLTELNKLENCRYSIAEIQNSREIFSIRVIGLPTDYYQGDITGIAAIAENLYVIACQQRGISPFHYPEVVPFDPFNL